MCHSLVMPDENNARALQVAGEAVKDLPSWAGPDVIIAAAMSKLDSIVAAASAEVCSSLRAAKPGMLGLAMHTLHSCAMNWLYAECCSLCRALRPTLRTVHTRSGLSWPT